MTGRDAVDVASFPVADLELRTVSLVVERHPDGKHGLRLESVRKGDPARVMRVATPEFTADALIAAAKAAAHLLEAAGRPTTPPTTAMPRPPRLRAYDRQGGR